MAAVAVIAAIGTIGSLAQGRKSQKAMLREMRRQRELAQQQLNFAKEQWDYYQDTYGDITKLMVADAMNTEVGDFSGVSDKANADVASQFEAKREAENRRLFAYGLDPSSGRYTSQNRTTDAQQALGSVLAQNQATQAEKMRVDNNNNTKRMQVGMFGQGQINRGENLYAQAMQNMQNVSQGNASTQAQLASNLFSNAGQFAGYGIGTALNKWGKKNPTAPSTTAPSTTAPKTVSSTVTAAANQYDLGFNPSNNNYEQAYGLDYGSVNPYQYATHA